MTLPLVAMRGPNQLAPFAGFVQENEQAEVLAAIHERIEAEMGLDIRFQDLRDEFLLHIGFLVNRVRYDVQITEDAAGLVDRRYPLAFQMASLARAVIEEHTGRAIQEPRSPCSPRTSRSRSTTSSDAPDAKSASQSCTRTAASRGTS